MILHLLLILLLLTTPVSAGMVIGSGASDIIFWVNFPEDTLTLETNNCNNGTDTVWAVADDADINSTAALSGTYGLQIPTEYARIYLDVTSQDYCNNTKGAIVFMFKKVTHANGFEVLGLDGSAWSYLEVTATDELKMHWKWNGESEEASVTTPDANMSTGVPYFVVFTYNADTDSLGLHVYSTSCVESGAGGTSSAAINPMSITGLWLGDHGTSNYANAYIDKVAIFDGTITRTAQGYCELVRDSASCPR